MFLTDLFSFRWPGGYIYTAYHQDHIENINLFITFSLYVCLKLQYRHTHRKYIFSLSWLQPMSFDLYIHNDLSVSTKHSYKMWWYIKYTHGRHFDTHQSLLWNVMAYQPFFIYPSIYLLYMAVTGNNIPCWKTRWITRMGILLIFMLRLWMTLSVNVKLMNKWNWWHNS